MMAYRLFLTGPFRPPVRPDASVFGERQWVGLAWLAAPDHLPSGAQAILLTMLDRLLSVPSSVLMAMLDV